MIRLVRPVLRNPEVMGLLRRQLGELNAQLRKVKRRDFFVELLRQHVDTDGVFAGLHHSSICAIVWFEKLVDITNDG